MAGACRGDRDGAEFEIWVWTDSPVLERLLGWSGHSPGLRIWMADHALWPRDALKPPRPKESLEKVLRQVARRSTTAVFADLAASLGLETCKDPAFVRLREILTCWFPCERGS